MQTPGEILRAEREKKGLSLKDVEQSTSIRALYLNAIEEGNYSIVPGEVYLKGFIRNYAAFLGLNGPEMVELYRQLQNASAAPASQGSTEKQTEKPAVKPVSLSQKVKEERAASSIWKWLLLLLVIILVAAAGFWYFSSSAKPSVPNPSNVQSSQPAPAAPANPAPIIPVAPSAPPPALPQAKPVVINVKYTDECWTEVVADGKEVYEGIPKIGTSMTWDAQQQITVRLGNAGGAEIVYNGQPQGKLGGRGDVLVKTFAVKQ